MTDLIDGVRMFVYAHVAEHGALPMSAQIADGMAISAEDVRDRLAVLASRRTIVLDPATGEVWMAAPYSAKATRFRVHGSRTSWWASCAWDMFGIPATLGVSAGIDASCACCDEPMHIDVDAKRGPTTNEGLVHLFVPARHWFDDIGFT